MSYLGRLLNYILKLKQYGDDFELNLISHEHVHTCAMLYKSWHSRTVLTTYTGVLITHCSWIKKHLANFACTLWIRIFLFLLLPNLAISNVTLHWNFLEGIHIYQHNSCLWRKAVFVWHLKQSINLLELLLFSIILSLSIKVSLPFSSLCVWIFKTSNFIFFFLIISFSFIWVSWIPLAKDSRSSSSRFPKSPFEDPWTPNNTKQWVWSLHCSISALNNFFNPYSFVGPVKAKCAPVSFYN